jgi:hypothetical protein
MLPKILSIFGVRERQASNAISMQQRERRAACDRQPEVYMKLPDDMAGAIREARTRVWPSKWHPQ